MGSCLGVCNSNYLKLKGDVIIEKNSDNETGKYLETQYMKKVIYLQKSVKQYLRKIKSKQKINNNQKENQKEINSSNKNSPSSKKNKSTKQPNSS